MMTPVLRNSFSRVTVVGSLISISLTLLVATFAAGVPMVKYGAPVRLLLGLALAAVVLLGSRYLALRRTETRTEWDRSWGAAALIVAAVFLLANQLVLRGIAVGIYDADGEMFPFQVLVSDFARSGRFLLWDPWSDAGLPLAGDPSVGAFSPVNLGVGLLTGGTSMGFSIYWLLVWSLGGLGILLLARHLKAPAWGGAVVAIGFLFSGVYTGNAEHTSCVVAFSFLPLIIWRLDQALVSRRLRFAAEAGALWGLSALSAYPALTIITGFFCALWTAGRLAFPEGSKLTAPASELPGPQSPILGRFRLGVAALTIFVVVGGAILSPTYYAFFSEGASTTSRSGPINRQIAISSNALDPGALSTIASSYVAALKAENQLEGDGKLWPGTDLSMCSIYSGAAVTIFALLAILVCPRDRWRWWLIILSGLSLACALGGFLPLRGWLYDLIYPMRFFRHPALFGFYCVFTISVLALIGIRDLQSAIKAGADPIWRRFRIASLVCALTSFTVFLTVIGHTESELRNVFKQGPLIWLLASGAWLAILGLAVLAVVWPKSARLKKNLPAFLLAIAVADAFLTYTVSQGHMVSDKREDVARWKSLDARHSSNLDLTPIGLMREPNPCESSDAAHAMPKTNPNTAIRCPFSDQLITKMPVLESYSTLPNPFLIRIAKHPILKTMAVGSERIWFTPVAVQAAASEDNFSAFEQRAEKLQAPPLVIHSRRDLATPNEKAALAESRNQDLARIDELPACSRIPVRVIKYVPDELLFDCSCPSDGWVVVTDRWGPSWRGEVNGEPTVVDAGDFIFRAIRVRAGENTIRLIYRPALFPWLPILSWTTLGVIAVSSISSGARRFKSGRKRGKVAFERQRSASDPQQVFTLPTVSS